MTDDAPGAGDGPSPASLQVPHLHRPDGRLQVGFGPGAWVVDGWRPGGGPADPATALVSGLVSPARPEQRAAPRCCVQGEGSLAAELRRRLAGGPVPPADLPPVDPGAAASVVVLVSPYAVPVGTARRPDLAGCTVLPVVPQTGRVVIGPVCGLPGGPCLHCLDLHRRDRDAQWPELVARLDDPLSAAVPPVHEPAVTDAALMLVLLLVTALVRGDRAAAGPGVSLEVGPRAPHLVTRRWDVHPVCPWHAPGGR